MTIDVGGRAVRVSSPDRVVFPEVGATKGDVARYYAAVGGRLLAAVGDRPTTLERWPKGVLPGMTLGDEGFYSKRTPRGAPEWVQSVQITFPSGRTALEVCPTEPAVAVWAAQMGTITLHPWPVSTPDVDHPDQLRLDFDPSPGSGFADAAAVAKAARDLLGELGWTAFAKTSGGRGMHVFVPLQPRWTFVEVRHAVIGIARELERRQPDRVTTSWWKEDRGARVFVDFNQAARDRTMASAWSIRARTGAPVSVPVEWDELPELDPAAFDLFTAPERLALADPWAAMADLAFDLSPALALWQADVDRGLGELPYPPDYPKMPGEPKRVQPSRARTAPDGPPPR
ncbi:MAG: ATP-dependent DNA ligase [Actinobacteria bacterium]|nr:MAG: ATP-dependent DNA ligase [Actinomycetota bacterium]